MAIRIHADSAKLLGGAKCIDNQKRQMVDLSLTGEGLYFLKHGCKMLDSVPCEELYNRAKSVRERPLTTLLARALFVTLDSCFNKHRNMNSCVTPGPGAKARAQLADCLQHAHHSQGDRSNVTHYN